MTTTIHDFPHNPGYLLHRCTAAELEPLIQEVDQIQQAQGHGYTPANLDLVGAIDREFHLRSCRSHIEALVLPMAEQYIIHYHYERVINRMGLNAQGLELGALWVNFQQQYEYNPIHQHDGLFSFVIWLDIPYERAQEQAQGPGQRQDKTNGDFQFNYTNSLGQIKQHILPVDSTWNHCLCLFPADLHHTVYPYYSTDRNRITVSGNIHLVWQGRKLEP